VKKSFIFLLATKEDFSIVLVCGEDRC